MVRFHRETGYVPSGNERPDPAEVAALQERARADHQAALAAIITRTLSRGGSCSMNNNIDLLAAFPGENVLIEAKSLRDVRMAVDRMRYAIGQLADDQRRYRNEIGEGRTAVAFGSSLGREEEFVGDVLDSKGIGLLLFEDGRLDARNQAALALSFFP